MTVLDGRTGQPILDAPVRTAGSSQASPLAISVEGKGHDLFMYFTLDCLGHEGESSEFQFFQGSDFLGICGPNFIALLKHNKIMLTSKRVPVKIPLYMYMYHL